MKGIMSMKKIIFVFLGIIMLFSCDRNEENVSPKATSGDFTINLWFSDEMLAIFDINAVFTDHAGNVVTESITEENTVLGVTTDNMHLLEELSPLPEDMKCFTKEFNNQKFPTSLTYQLFYSLKEDPDESYFYDINGVTMCDIAYCYEQLCVDNFGTQLAENMFSRVIVGLVEESIDGWAEIQSKIYHKIEIDADGVVTINK